MRILILSQPKCGSTAIYYKVKKALPNNTLCLFEPLNLTEACIEVKQKKNALVKYLVKPWTKDSDLSYYDISDAFDKVIVLHRDPRDFMISAFLYSYYEAFTGRDLFAMSQTIHMLEQKESDPASLSFIKMAMIKNCLERGDVLTTDFENIRVLTDKFGNELDLRIHPLHAVNMTEQDYIERLLTIDFSVSGFLNYVKNSCRSMLEINKYFQTSNISAQDLSYSDLVENNLESVSKYLGLDIGEGTDIDAQHKRVIRTKGTGDWRKWLTSFDIQYMEEMFSDYMEFFGYPNEWTLAEQPIIKPEHSSDYVFRLFNERYEAHPEVNISFNRETLTELARAQMENGYESDHLIPGLEPRKTEDIGKYKVSLHNFHIKNSEGVKVNLLVPGEKYYYCYDVEFNEDVTGVSFWMMITNQNSMPVLNGTSFDGDASHEYCSKGDKYSVAYPFVCDLKRGLYFCNAGVTHCTEGTKHDVCRRHVMAYCFLVAKPIPKKWVAPTVVAGTV